MSYSATSSGQPLRILALDGGGVRGLSELVVLKSIMDSVRFQLEGNGVLGPDERLRPCDFFDLICGTSTGGLIALMLGRLQMTVHECLKSYSTICEKVFDSPRLFAGKKFDHNNLEQEIRHILVSQNKTASEPLAVPLCVKTFVVAVQADGGGASRLRSYSQRHETAAECTILQAARATTAAPTFFAPITVVSPTTGTRVTYIDAGLGHNNPAELAILEAQQVWGNREVGLLLSIGSGTSAPPRFGQSILGYRTKINAAVFVAGLITDCENIHHRILRDPRFQKDQNYFRFSVDNLGDVKLDEWKELGLLNARTSSYMTEKPDILESKTRCVDVLAKMRVASDNTDVGEEVQIDVIPEAEKALEDSLLDKEDLVDVRRKLLLAVEPYQSAGDLERVMAIMRKTYDFAKEHYPETTSLQYIKREIAITFSAKRDNEEAAKWEREIFEYFETAFGDASLHTCDSAWYMVVYLLASNDRDEWPRYYNILLNYIPTIDEDEAVESVWTPRRRVELAQVFVVRLMLDKAAENMREAWKVWDSMESGNDRKKASIVIQNIGYTYEQRREYEIAQEFYTMLVTALLSDAQLRSQSEDVLGFARARLQRIARIRSGRQE